MKKPVKILAVRTADASNQVVTIEGGSGAYRKKPCPECPWIKDNDGNFPAEAFRHSANCAEDMADRTFGCHQSGSKAPATCAGFLLKNAANNMSVRVQYMRGNIKNDITDGGYDLHESYREMAIANGVPAYDPALAKCRDN